MVYNISMVFIMEDLMGTSYCMVLCLYGRSFNFGDVGIFLNFCLVLPFTIYLFYVHRPHLTLSNRNENPTTGHIRNSSIILLTLSVAVTQFATGRGKG